MNQDFVFRRLLETAAGTALPGWHRFADALTVHTYTPGAVVFAQGVENRFVFAVRVGLVKLCYLGEDGGEWIKSFVDEGRFFCSIAALQARGCTSFTASAIEPSVLERIDFGLLARLAQQHLEWAQALNTLTLALAARKEARERELLMLKAADRYLAFCGAHPELARRVPQKELARHLGVTPVGLNRIVSRLRRLNPSKPWG